MQHQSIQNIFIFFFYSFKTSKSKKQKQMSQYFCQSLLKPYVKHYSYLKLPPKLLPHVKNLFSFFIHFFGTLHERYRRGADTRENSNCKQERFEHIFKHCEKMYSMLSSAWGFMPVLLWDQPTTGFCNLFFIYFFMGGRVDYKEFGLNFGWNKDLKDNSKENRFVSPLFLRTEQTLFGIEEELFHVTLVWSQLDLMKRKQKRSPQLGSLWLL